MKFCPTGCGRNAKPGHLMCGPCWAIVPRPLQVAVYRTFDAFKHARSRGYSGTNVPVDTIKAARDYAQASDAAIAAARA